jgi:hypothetical protein
VLPYFTIAVRCAVVVKRTLHGWKYRGRFLKLKRALISLQCVVRVIAAKKVYRAKKFIFLTIRVQSWVRMHRQRRELRKKIKASVVLSAWMRMVLQRIRFTTMIEDIRENNKLSSQLDFLKTQLLQEAEARQAAEKVTENTLLQ